MKSRGWICTLALCSVLAMVLAPTAQAQKFATLATGEEVVPAVETDAFAFASFRFFRFFGAQFLVTARLQLRFESDITAAHIHCAAAGANGDIVLDYEVGEIFDNGWFTLHLNTSDDLEGPLAGMTLQALIDKIRAGEAYLDIHTVDFPEGEVRGQIESLRAASRAASRR
jgi:hypothetical protein